MVPYTIVMSAVSLASAVCRRLLNVSVIWIPAPGAVSAVGSSAVNTSCPVVLAPTVAVAPVTAPCAAGAVPAVVGMA